MDPPHAIRLHAAWQVEPEKPPATGWRWWRGFQWPNELTDGERVWIVLEAGPDLAGVALNGSRLEPTPVSGSTWDYDVTRRLQGSNRLECVVRSPPPTPHQRGPLPAEVATGVRLEVRWQGRGG